MKLGIFLLAIGIVILITGLVFMTMNIVMSNLMLAFWSFVYFTVAGGLLLAKGIKRIRGVKV